MWIALAALALIAVAVAIVIMFRRPSGDDLDSVRSYHSALGTLEHLSDRTGTSTVTVVGREEPPGATGEVGVPRSYRRSGGAHSGARAGVGTGRSVPPVPVRGNDEFPDPETPLIFDDSRPQDRFRLGATAEGASVARTDRGQRHALDSMNHRPRRVTTVAIVVAAVVVFAVLAYAGSKRSSPSHTHAATATSTSAATSHSSVTTSTAHSSTPPTTKPKPKTKPTPTTQPTQVVPLTSTSTSATYAVVNANYKLTVTGTGTCWVAVTSSSGSTLWAGEVQAGTVQVVPASGTINVQLGTPTVTMAIDKVPVVLPTPVRAPFVATFQPTAAALVASPPTTSTTPTTVGSSSSSSGSTATSSTTPP